MRIVTTVLLLLVIVSSAFAATAASSAKGKSGWTVVKGSINLPSTAKKAVTANISKGPVAYVSSKGFKGANTAPKGVIQLNASMSKLDLEKQQAAARKAASAKPTKYTALIQALTNKTQNKGYRKY